VVALAASKTALGLWAAVAEDRFGTRSIPDLRGWLRRSPLLAAGLVLTTLATFGVPGWVAFEARTDVATLAADGPFGALLIIAGFLALPTYVRLLAIGAGAVTSRVDGATPERISLRRRPPETLTVELEGVELPAVETSTTTVAGVISVSRTRGRRMPPAGPADPASLPRSASASVPVTGIEEAAEGSAPSDRSAPSEMPFPTLEDVRARRLARARVGTGGGGATVAASSLGGRFAAGLQRNRTELLSGTVLALAVLAALTSYGALDLAGAAAEPAPILLGP
jgi:hypothetical protein